MAVYSLQNQAFRLAMWSIGAKLCVWCKRPISLIEMEIDHLVYKAIEVSELNELIEHFALRTGFDVDETYNLAPSC